MSTLTGLIDRSIYRDNPISELMSFIEQEKRHKDAREVEKMRFIGYVLELGFDSAKIITSDQYKIIVGGVPRGSFLVMIPSEFGSAPPHFSLLRVKGVSTTPLSSQVQQTYFELHKKAMPELDIWTQNELQWGALECDVLGMFYANPRASSKLEFSGDVNNIVSAHRYEVYAPSDELLKVIVNGIVPEKSQFELGSLRTMECRLIEGDAPSSDIPVNVSMEDFKGRRTAMFGKTRLGKSNVVKLLAQGMINATNGLPADQTVGQLIFDINGEYANDNPQDGNKSLRSSNEERCIVYALTPRAGTPSKVLRLNFYEYPATGLQILAQQLSADNRTSGYIASFASASLVNFDELEVLDVGDKTRAARRIMYYWAILKKAGYAANESVLRSKIRGRNANGFNPGFAKDLRLAAHGKKADAELPSVDSLDALLYELEKINAFRVADPQNQLLFSGSRKPLFEPDDVALLDFLFPKTGVGPVFIRPYQKYHDANATDFTADILGYLEEGKTVILDLGNAEDIIRQYFSDILSAAVFSHQEKKFTTNTLNKHFIQLYFEEAHNLFPASSNNASDIYSRFAKEGAKFHTGMIYSTQSPSTISKELLAQTENFFVGHLSSQDEAHALARLQVAFDGIEQDILRAKTPGFMRMLTMSNRFVVPVQAKLYEGV
ncbi:DUF87 domain-containing protein [Eubacteriales bacterium OttesenSCG-928-M02]|nr:DUF87 domain-containing protein [Eubacteriales bacterium OttesenSCG-928-M02]